MIDDLCDMQASTSPEEPHQIHTKSFGTTFLDFPATFASLHGDQQGPWE
ncbi:MAG: hypothetical protein JWP89_5735 [Schlesneria sp.]|nr:hypothetical protein [Schlesneria sp.]